MSEPVKDDQQSFDERAADEDQQVPVETPRHYDIIPANSVGDMIFECEDNVSFLVSSAVLRISSIVFEKKLEGGFMKSRYQRSATNPPRIPLATEDSRAARRLFRLLHHQRDPYPGPDLTNHAPSESRDRIASAARELREFAVAVDLYDCSQTLSNITDSLLRYFAMPNKRAMMSFQATIDVVSAAYQLENSRYFLLFTKRLLSDHTHGFQNAELAFGDPLQIRLELERQSARAWTVLRDHAQRFATGRCTAYLRQCITGISDQLLVQKLAACLLPPGTTWPMQRNDGFSLRCLLRGLCRLEPLQRVSWCDLHEVHIFDSIGKQSFALLCEAVDRELAGLCLSCTKAPTGEPIECRCDRASRVQAMVLVNGDSFLIGRG